MKEELPWIFAFNLIVNPLLTFFLIVLLVQALLFLFRIKSMRFRSLAMTLPFLKVFLDPFLYDFSKWALLNDINPLHAELGSRTFFITLLPSTYSAVGFSVLTNYSFTLADIIALSVPAALLKVLVLGIGSLTVLSIAHFFRHLFQAQKWLATLRQNGSQQEVLISSEIDVPCAFGLFRRRICFPEGLIEKLSADEFEAVVAHEKNHLVWQDGLIRTLCRGVASLYWWIPTKFWLLSLEESQELACDQQVLQKEALASALIKCWKMTQNRPLVSNLVSAKTSTLAFRLAGLLSGNSREDSLPKWRTALLIGILCSLLMGHFWIF